MPEKTNNASKIAVISDTHIPSRAKQIPASIHKHFNGADLIIHCGDFVEENVLIELRALAPVYAVKGNMDGHDIKEPLDRILEINNKFIICVSHGSGSPLDLKQRLYKKFSQHKPYMIIYGHTHFPEISEYNNIIFFNPGSCTCGAEYNSIGMLEIKKTDISCSIIPL